MTSSCVRDNEPSGTVKVSAIGAQDSALWILFNVLDIC
jgi:hypothetical protein